MCRNLYIGILAIFFFNLASGQSPINAFSAHYVAGTTSVSSYTALPAPGSSSFNSCSSSNYTYTFKNGSNNNLKLSDIVANARNYFITEKAGVVKLRRVNNPNATGDKKIIFLESTTSPAASCPGGGSFNFKSPYNDVMEDFLNVNSINQGSDNLFTNAGNGDGNMNNIERVDVMFPEGIATASPNDAGFAVLDRGANNGHDAFRIAPILRLNSNGDPDSFGVVKTCIGGNGSNNGSWGHPATANGNPTIAGYVLRKEQADSRLRVSTALNQQLGGVFFSFSDLGIAPYQEIYGYALLAADGIANPTSNQLLAINDATVYPTNTAESAGGGLDLIAVTATFASGPLVSRIDATISGSQTNTGLTINWKVTGIAPLSTVELQISTDGLNFKTVYSEIATNQLSQGFYRQHNAGSYFYRLQITLPVGRIHFSRVIQAGSNKDALCRIYPNLLTSDRSFVVDGLNDDRYKAVLINASGQVKTVNLVVANGRGLIKLPGSIAKGLYYVRFINAGQQGFEGGRLIIK